MWQKSLVWSVLGTIASFALVGCGGTNASDSTTVDSNQADARTVNYTCKGGQTFRAEFVPGQVTVDLPDKKGVILALTPSGSGPKYSNGIISVTTAGDDAVVTETNAILLADCTATAGSQEAPES